MVHSGPDNRSRLLEAAEELFAEKGWAGASMRELTARAGANLAAVGYHFGGKQELFREVVLRRIRAINEVRLERLDALEAAATGVTLEAVLFAFIDPVLESAQEPRGQYFMRLVGRTHGDPDGPWRTVIEGAPFRGVFERFCLALGKVLPQVSSADIAGRVHLMVGALVHTLLHGTQMGTSVGRPACGSEGSPSELLDSVRDSHPSDESRQPNPQGILRGQLLPFLLGAFSAPSTVPAQ